LLFGKGDIVVSDKNLHTKVGISHGVLHDDWVDMNWDTLSKVFGAVGRVIASK
jgi:hypothetical protein